MTWSHFPIANAKYERIKKDPRFKNQKPRDTVALSPSDELKFTEAGTGEEFEIPNKLKFKAAVAYNIWRSLG